MDKFMTHTIMYNFTDNSYAKKMLIINAWFKSNYSRNGDM